MTKEIDRINTDIDKAFVNIMMPFEKMDPQDYGEVVTRLQKNIVTLKRLTDDALIGMSERCEAKFERLKVEITGLQDKLKAADEVINLILRPGSIRPNDVVEAIKNYQEVKK